MTQKRHSDQDPLANGFLGIPGIPLVGVLAPRSFCLHLGNPNTPRPDPLTPPQPTHATAFSKCICKSTRRSQGTCRDRSRYKSWAVCSQRRLSQAREPPRLRSADANSYLKDECKKAPSTTCREHHPTLETLKKPT